MQAGSLVEAHQPGHEAQPAKVDDDLSVEEIAQEPRQQRPFVLLFDLSACPLHDVPVLNAGGTSRLARQASQAAVDVRDKSFAHRHVAFVDVQHLIDAAARRIHLHTQNFVGRAMVQAKSAVHAGAKQLPGGNVLIV